MKQKLDPGLISMRNEEVEKEISDCVCEVLHSDEASRVEVAVGDVFLMNDHDKLIEVVVVSLNRDAIRVMDKQGFFHDTQRWMFCSCSETLILKSLVAGKNKARSGYNPTAQQEICWDSWMGFLRWILPQPV